MKRSKNRWVDFCNQSQKYDIDQMPMPRLALAAAFGIAPALLGPSLKLKTLIE
jgi:hypothetical protein